MANQGEQKVPALSAEQLATIAQVVAELRKPNEFEAAKLEEQRKKKEKDEREAIEVAKSQAQAEDMKRLNCPHYRKIGGQIKHSWRGQVSSGDGMVRACCVQCQTEAPIFKATPDMVANGVGLEERNVDWNAFAAMHKQTFPDGCNRGRCPVCKK